MSLLSSLFFGVIVGSALVVFLLLMAYCQLKLYTMIKEALHDSQD